MSLWHVYESGLPPPSRQQLADALSGNLCRCTGYRPILDAGQRMFDLPAVPLDPGPVVAALAGLRDGSRADFGDGGLHYSAPAAPAGGAAARVDHFHAPDTLEQLARLRRDQPSARLLAGGTDIGLWVTK